MSEGKSWSQLICLNCGETRGEHFTKGVITRCPCLHENKAYVTKWPWDCHACDLFGTEFKEAPQKSWYDITALNDGPARDAHAGGHPRFHELLREMADLHDRKNADYAHGGRPLGNFERRSVYLAQFPGLNLSDPPVIALTDMMKQLDAAFWMLSQGHESQTGEDVGKRLGDAANYAVLARILWEEGSDTG